MTIDQQLQSFQAKAIISVVDDDESIRKSLKRLLKSIGFETRVFPSAMDFLNDGPLQAFGCAIIDVRMPVMSGLDLQRQLLANYSKVPVIFITAHDDNIARQQALEAGAIAFLQKPFSDLSLRDAILIALEKSNRETSGM
jgi:FixJ family two-component response regulator